MDFYLGTHLPQWLTWCDVPLFVSRSVLKNRKTFPRAKTRWALDSGAFSELAKFGKWTIPAKEYAGFVERVAGEVGNLEWAAPQDWMCEPHMLGKTGMTILQHQELTTRNWEELCGLSTSHIIPVLQGWGVGDYARHVEMYDKRGYDLREQPVVGLGSVCRRQDTRWAESIVTYLTAQGLKIHAFGFKVTGLKRVAHLLRSSDSMSWSYAARCRGHTMEGCSHRAKRCNHCPKWAMDWREALLLSIRNSCGGQLPLVAE